MLKPVSSLLVASLLLTITSGISVAASWQDKLSSTASDLLNSSSGTDSVKSAQSSGLSLSSLSGLLNGGDKALASKNISNATGVLQYCLNNNLVKNNADSLTSELKSKLGLTSDHSATSQTSYAEGAKGLLSLADNNKVDLKSLGNTDLGKKIKTKACKVVLDQGKKYLGL